MKRIAIALSTAVALTAVSLASTTDAGARQRLLPYNGLDRAFGGGAVLLPGTRAFPETSANRCVPGPAGEVFVEINTHRYVHGRRGKGRALRTGRIGLVKVDSRGRRVRGFGRSGMVGWSPRSQFRPAQIKIDGSGRPVILSHPPDKKPYPETRRYVLTRLTPAGRIDRGFGDGGRITLGVLGDTELELLPDGRLVVESRVQSGTRLLVLDPTGRPQPGFAAGQPVIVGLYFPTVTSATIGSQSVIVAAGTLDGPPPSYPGIATVMFIGADGAPTPAFGSDGRLSVNSFPAAALGDSIKPVTADQAAKFDSHGLVDARVTGAGELDVVISSSNAADNGAGSVLWVRRLNPSGEPEPGFGIGGAAVLSADSGSSPDFASDEYEFRGVSALADAGWLTVYGEALYDHPAIPAGEPNLYFGTRRLAPDGRRLTDTPFDAVKEPTGVDNRDVEPAADGKSIVWCGHTSYRTHGAPRVTAWVARAPMVRN